MLLHKYVESHKIYRSSRSLLLLKLNVLKSFADFTGKHLCWSLFLKKLQAWYLHLIKSRLQYRFFLVKFAKLLTTSLFAEHLLWLRPNDLLYLVRLVSFVPTNKPFCDQTLDKWNIRQGELLSWVPWTFHVLGESTVLSS